MWVQGLAVNHESSAKHYLSAYSTEACAVNVFNRQRLGITIRIILFVTEWSFLRHTEWCIKSPLNIPH